MESNPEEICRMTSLAQSMEKDDYMEATNGNGLAKSQLSMSGHNTGEMHSIAKSGAQSKSESQFKTG